MLSLRVRRTWSPAPSASRIAGELEARRAAARIGLGETASGLSSVPEETGLPPSHAQEALDSPGQPLDERVRADFESRFGHDFSRVRVHTDAGAARSARALGARAYTYGQDIVFGPGRYEPASSSGQSLIAHELAHVVQQGRAGRAAVQLASELESLPEEDRKKIQVITETLSEELRADLERVYLAPGVPELPPGMTVRFGAAVAKSSQAGLNAVADVLADRMPPNTSITLAISAAGAVYRFTRVDQSATKAELMVVEKTGNLGSALKPIPTTKPVWEASPGPYSKAHGPLTHRQARQMSDCLSLGAGPGACQVAIPETTLPEGDVEIRKTKMTRGPGWKLSDWAAVSGALENLPETVLNRARGYTFQREAKKVCTPEAVKADKCDPNTDAETSIAHGTITLFDPAFRESTTRHGTSTLLESTLIHEIGHVADLVFLGNAMFGYLGTSKGPDDKKKVMETRSLSGMGWTENALLKEGTVVEYMDPGGAPAGSFREAAIQDGLNVEDDSKKIVSGGVTAYGETAWGELFADTYMLYFTDPELLKAIRPHVYKYFEAAWPQKKKKK